MGILQEIGGGRAGMIQRITAPAGFINRIVSGTVTDVVVANPRGGSISVAIAPVHRDRYIRWGESAASVSLC